MHWKRRFQLGIGMGLVALCTSSAFLTPGLRHSHRGGEHAHSHGSTSPSHMDQHHPHAVATHRHHHSHHHSHAHTHGHSHSHATDPGGDATQDGESRTARVATSHVHFTLFGLQFTISGPWRHDEPSAIDSEQVTAEARIRHTDAANRKLYRELTVPGSSGNLIELLQLFECPLPRRVKQNIDLNASRSLSHFILGHGTGRDRPLLPPPREIS